MLMGGIPSSGRPGDGSSAGTGNGPAGGGFERRNERDRPVDWVLPEAEVKSWVKRARPGERLLYGRGLRLVQGATTRLLANLAAQGDVAMIHPRSKDQPGFDHLVIRNRVRFVTDHRRAAPRTAAPLDPIMAGLFLKLKEAARCGHRCPSDGALALSLGVSRDQLKWALRKLISAGLVLTRIVPAPGDPKWRIVTIVATGLATKGPGE